MNPVAAAAGLNTIAAPHKPAPATTLTLARSKVVIDVCSYKSARGAAKPQSRTGVVHRHRLNFY
jgi:hypothetical protein